jgi:probable rRNA maturation factor
MAISLRVDAAVRTFVPGRMGATLRARARKAMRAAGVGTADLSILLTSDAEIRVLNRDFRGIDRPTDVLSFSQREGALAPQAHLLGDIVISVETARRRGKRGLEGELLHLTIHGLLHLVGYDHATPAEARRMFALTRRIYDTCL